MRRPLNSDELGHKGEKKFEDYCIDAKLICNPSSRDRAGWDFIVETPFVTNSGALDSRKHPSEARVQVKSLWAGNAQIKFRLSSLERLAKSVNPCVILVLVFSNDLEVQSMHAIHVLDGFLEVILKKLRKCEAEGSLSVNKETLSINYSKYSKVLPGSGAAIKDFIGMISISGLDDYAKQKSDQIRNLGYQQAAVKGQFTVSHTGTRELAEFLLGMKPLQATDFFAEEFRWDIPLPIMRSASVTTISVSPKTKTGRIVLSKKGRLRRITVEAELTPPALIPKGNKDFLAIRVKSSFLEIVILAGSAAEYSINCKNVPRKLADHLETANALAFMADGD